MTAAVQHVQEAEEPGEGQAVALHAVPSLALPRWGIIDALLGFPIIFASALIIGFSFALAFPGGALGVSAASLFLYQLAIAFWPSVVSWTKGSGPKIDFGIRILGVTDFVSAVVLGFTLLMLGSLVSGLTLWLLDLKPADQTTNTGLLTGAAGGPWIWVMISLTVVGAPVAEELFFRGLLLGAIRKRFAHRRFGDTAAVLISAAAFTAVHYNGGSFQSSVVMFAVIGSIGLCLGAYVVKTNRIAPAIIAHGVFNALVVMAIL